jgi:hypothetical protein
MKMTADRLAKNYAKRGVNPDDRESLRDLVDLDTGGAHDAVPLDILTDMIAARLTKKDDNQ